MWQQLRKRFGVITVIWRILIFKDSKMYLSNKRNHKENLHFWYFVENAWEPAVLSCLSSWNFSKFNKTQFNRVEIRWLTWPSQNIPCKLPAKTSVGSQQRLPNANATLGLNSRPFTCSMGEQIIKKWPTPVHETAFESIVPVRLRPWKEQFYILNSSNP